MRFNSYSAALLLGASLIAAPLFGAQAADLGLGDTQDQKNVFSTLGKAETPTAGASTSFSGFESVQKGEINFDRCIATPDMMGLVGRLGKVLGPRGLMPNPRVGTVTMDVTAAVAASKGGSVEFRVEKAGIVHAAVGKASFSADKLSENIKAFVDSVAKAKPAGAKGTYIQRVALSSTMGPGVKIEPNTVIGG